jgi:hypothetical protein
MSLLQNKRNCSLHYSVLFTVPFLNSFLYLFQLFLARKKLLYVFFAASTNNRMRNILMDYIDKNFQLTFCTTHQFGMLLKIFKQTKIILDLKEKKIDKKSPKAMYEFMWSVIAASKLTKKTFFHYKSLLPSTIILYD